MAIGKEVAASSSSSEASEMAAINLVRRGGVGDEKTSSESESESESESSSRSSCGKLCSFALANIFVKDTVLPRRRNAPGDGLSVILFVDALQEAVCSLK